MPILSRAPPKRPNGVGPHPPKAQEATPAETGKTFAAKLAPRLTRRVEAAMEEQEIPSNSAFLQHCIKVALPILERHNAGFRIYAEQGDERVEIIIAG